jgi:hypothetical protein
MVTGLRAPARARPPAEAFAKAGVFAGFGRHAVPDSPDNQGTE